MSPDCIELRRTICMCSCLAVSKHESCSGSACVSKSGFSNRCWRGVE
ncbi:hypothetical protein M6B38_377555 [Iris pallida]|uniref:Uncharacterized protein n=1 Tax=Iris pallida TaxID=29817 RepID=A0AAX6GAA5_IRIPA|nr:hypothetical protein M6B38_377555 [Iris pallida]